MPVAHFLLAHFQELMVVDSGQQAIKGYDTHISKLNYTQLAEVSQTVVRRILVHNEGDILHRLGTKPTSHLGRFLIAINN